MTAVAPLVTIGIPTYNRSGDLNRAIACAIGQDYPNIEVIVCDNASTDDTEAVCRDIVAQQTRVQYVRQATNVGAIGNFSHVLSLAHGEFFMWLADDDWIDSQYVSRCCEFLTAHPDFVLACGKDLYFRAGELSEAGPQVSLTQSDPKDRVRQYFSQVSLNGMFYGLMRRSVIASVELSKTLAFDWLVMAQVAMSGKSMTLESVNIYRDQSGESQDLTQLALSLGYAKSAAKNPWWLITRICFVEIAFRGEAFKSLNAVERLVLGTQIAVTIFDRQCILPVKLRFKARAAAYRCDLQRLLDRHIGWRFKR